MSLAPGKEGSSRFSLALRIIAMAAATLFISSCSSTSQVSSWTDFDSDSDTAIVLLGTKISQRDGTVRQQESLEPRVLSTHWQLYDPQSLRLVRGNSLIFSTRVSTVFSEEEFDEWEVTALKVPPGNYALTVAVINRNLTTFVIESGSRTKYRKTLSGLSVDIDAPVDSTRNYLLRVKPGQIAYIGHFDFQTLNHRSDVVVGIDYTLDEAAAQALLGQFPGVAGEVVTLDISPKPSEQAAF